MGCGQSKINLYPRRNKNGGKTSSAKKSGATEKETDDEEGSTGAVPSEEGQDNLENGKHILPLAANPTPIEVSASQQDFFKMLDEKIEKGKDYDSSSETEIQIEQERRRLLLNHWRSVSRSATSQPSPPTPARRRTRIVPQTIDRQSSPAIGRRYIWGPTVADGLSPSPQHRRAHSAQSQHQHECQHMNGERDWSDSNSPPVRRLRTPSDNWDINPKPNFYRQTLDANDNQSPSSQRDEESSTYARSPREEQQHEPSQPFIAQIIPGVATSPRCIPPPEQYRDCAQQRRQQTALHLQHYVAMKQAQMQMHAQLQRAPHTVFPHVEFGIRQAEVVRPFELDPVGRPHSAPHGMHEGSQGIQVAVWPWPPPRVPPPAATAPYWAPPQPGPRSAGSAGTLTRYHKDRQSPTEGPLPWNNSCQTMNLVRHKPVGQIAMEGRELSVFHQNSIESGTPSGPDDASSSSSNGAMSIPYPGVNASSPVPTLPNDPGTPTSSTIAVLQTAHMFNTAYEVRNKKNKNIPFGTKPLKNSKIVDS